MKCITDLELQTIIKPEDIDPPLGSYIDGFFEGIFGGARACFEHDQKVMPYVFTLKDRKITPCMIKELTPDTKPSCFGGSRNRSPATMPASSSMRYGRQPCWRVKRS